MKQTGRRVVITGLGIISCLGLNRDDVTDALRHGRSGITFLPERRELGFQSGLSGVVSGFDPTRYLSKKQRKTLPEFGVWAWAALEQAFEQAGLDPRCLKGDNRTGMIFGNDSSAATAVEQVETLRHSGETKAIGSGHIIRLLNSTITLNISTFLGLHGHTWTVSGACASGAMAIGQASELIAAGRLDRAISGGAQEISWQSMCSFDTLGAFSRRQDDPAAASRPFDEERDGLVPSGGAAVLILEAAETAEARNAEILGEVLGYGNTTDGYHIVVPSGEGLERAMRMALDNAQIPPEKIDLVLAHATSTPTGDVVEAQALRNIFQPAGPAKSPWITAIKSLTGHEFWMAGASQVVYGLLMGREGFIAGIRNLKKPVPEANNLRFPLETVSMKSRYLLCNAAGFGGTNACLVIKNLQ